MAQAAAVGWMQRGNVMVNPAQGTAFVPGQGVVLMNQVFGPQAGAHKRAGP